MTALEHLSSLVGEKYKPEDLSFGISNILTVIVRVKRVERGRMKLKICTYQLSLDDVLGE